MYKNFCLLFPNPTPNNPPEPIAYKLCTIWYPVPVASAHGSKKVLILSCLKPPSPPPDNFFINTNAIPPASTAPPARKCKILHPAISIITELTVNITKETLKWFCIKYNIAIGGSKKIADLTNPLQKSFRSSLWSDKYPA